MSKSKKGEELNTMVLDTEKGFALEHVANPKGRLWRYGKDLIYLMQRIKENGMEKLIPYELPLEPGALPEKLFRALFWEREAAILFTLHSPLLEKLKIVGLYILIAILLLLIFMLFSSLTG